MHALIADAALLVALAYGAFAMFMVAAPLLRRGASSCIARHARGTDRITDRAQSPITTARLAAARYPLHTCNTRSF
jgi:hypothetical protein